MGICICGALGRDVIDVLRTADDIYIYDSGSTPEIAYLYLVHVAGLRTIRGIAASKVDEGLKKYGLPLFSLDALAGTDRRRVVIATKQVDAAGLQVVLFDAAADQAMRRAYAEWVGAWLTREKPEVVLFGASWYARTLVYALGEKPYRIAVAAMMTTTPPEKERTILDVAVIGVAEAEMISRQTPVIVATDERYHSEIMNTLKEFGFDRVFPLIYELASQCIRTLVQPHFGRSNRYTLVDSPCSPMEFLLYRTIDAAAPKAKMEQLPHWIFRSAETARWDEAKQALTEDLLEQQRALYGETPMLKAVLDGKRADPSASLPKIYMAKSRHDAPIRGGAPSLRLVQPIYVGADGGGGERTALTDNTGENISGKNSLYSEMTAAYWMWKNAPEAKYIGLCHYRRHFALESEDLLRLDRSDIDIVTLVPTLALPNNREFFQWSGYLDEEIFESLERIIENRAPDCLDSFRRVCSAHLLIPCNMFIMRRMWFDRYCSWCFPLTERLEEECARSGKLKHRFLGYVTELLLSTFLARHKDDAKIALADRILLS